VVVVVDAWTTYGGSQFVDSPGTGRYHSYLCDKVVPFVDARYRTLPQREHRAISGKSSGGFGAMITPMLRPDLFGALASHAGDALYELCYLAQFGKAVRYCATCVTTTATSVHGGLTSGQGPRSPSPQTGSCSKLLGVSACFSAREDVHPRVAVRSALWGAA